MNGNLELPEKPGAFAEFQTAFPTNTDAIKAFENTLDEYRTALAGVVGVTTDELHVMGNEDIQRRLEEKGVETDL